MNRLFARSLFLLNVLFFSAPTIFASTTQSFSIHSSPTPEILKRSSYNCYEPSTGDMSYLEFLFKQGSCTLEWEIPALRLETVRLIGSKAVGLSSRDNALRSEFHHTIHKETILREKSAILEYWHFTTLSSQQQPIDIVVPKTLALQIKNLGEKKLGVIKGVIIEIGLQESDNSFKPKSFVSVAGKLVPVDYPEPKPFIQVTRVVRSQKLSEESWRAGLDS